MPRTVCSSELARPWAHASKSLNVCLLFAPLPTTGKMQLLDKLLPKLKAAGNRVVLFSQFQGMLDIIEDYLRLRVRPHCFAYLLCGVTKRKPPASLDCACVSTSWQYRPCSLYLTSRQQNKSTPPTISKHYAGFVLPGLRGTNMSAWTGAPAASSERSTFASSTPKTARSSSTLCRHGQGVWVSTPRQQTV